MDYYRKLGYEVRQAEINYVLNVRGRIFYKKFDIGAADFFAWSKEKNEWLLVNSKFALTKEYIAARKSEAKKEFEKQNLPACVGAQVCIWTPRSKPMIFSF